MSESDAVSEYDHLLREMPEGVLLVVNAGFDSAVTSDEMRVEHTSDDETEVSLSGTAGRWFKIHRNYRDELMLSEVQDDGLSDVTEVCTFEVVGVDR